MIEIVFVKGGSINDQIITWLWNFDATGVKTLNDGFRVSIRVEIVAYTTRKSDAVIIGITPFADNRNSFLRSEISFKLTADVESAVNCARNSVGLVMLSPHFALEILKSSILLPLTSPVKIWKAAYSCFVLRSSSVSPGLYANAGIAMRTPWQLPAVRPAAF